jgi:hypothetical protein
VSPIGDATVAKLAAFPITIVVLRSSIPDRCRREHPLTSGRRPQHMRESE